MTGQQAFQSLTDSELLQLAGNPRATPEVMAKLTPEEKTRLQRLSQPQEDHSSAIDMLKSALGVGGDLAEGAFKGAGETAFHLGQGVRAIPGVGSITDLLAELVGPEGTDPEQAFSQVPADLKAENTAQSVGKGAEQIAEFFIPGKATWTAGNLMSRPLLNAWLKTNQKAQPVLSKALEVGQKGAEIAGDALAAGAVGAAHGDDPVNAAQWAAGGGVAGQTLSQLLRTLSTKTGQQIGPLIAAIMAMKAVESAGGGMAGTLGGGLGGFSVARSLAQSAIRKPGAVRRLRDATERAGESAGLVGAELSSGPRRRSQGAP